MFSGDITVIPIGGCGKEEDCCTDQFIIKRIFYKKI
jgi:hypothetical protein